MGAHRASFRPMRLQIALDDDLVDEIDRRAGPRRRSALIAELVRRGLENERRWDDIEAALGGLADSGHDWDDDPAAWVRRQRRDDSRPRRLTDGAPAARFDRAHRRAPRPTAARLAALRRTGYGAVGVRDLGRGDLARPAPGRGDRRAPPVERPATGAARSRRRDASRDVAPSLCRQGSHPPSGRLPNLPPRRQASIPMTELNVQHWPVGQ